MNKIFFLFPTLFSQMGIFGKCIGDKAGRKVFEKVGKDGEKLLTTINTQTGKVEKTIRFSPEQDMFFIKGAHSGIGHTTEVMDYKNGIRKDIKQLNDGDFTLREKVSRIMDSNVVVGTQSLCRFGNTLTMDVKYPLGNIHNAAEYQIKDGKVKHLYTVPSEANLNLFNVFPTITRL